LGPEEKVRREVKELLAMVTQFHVWDTEQGYRRGRGGSRVTPGLADLILIGHGRIVFVELKRPKGGVVGEAQKFFGKTVHANGGVYLIWRGKTDTMDWLVGEGIVTQVQR